MDGKNEKSFVNNEPVNLITDNKLLLMIKEVSQR